VSIPVVLDELISDEKGDVALDYVQTEYDIVLDVALPRSLVHPVIEVKPFNAETRAEIDVTYECPDSVIPELCDKDVCLVPVYRTNPSVANGASLLLPESSGFETYVKDIDYIYDDDGFLSLSEDRKAMPANEETFVFRSDYCLGDVNQDGTVSAADATVICSRLLDENLEMTEEEIFYGKITGDYGLPSVKDAVSIAKYAIGLVDADYKPV
ncbi:MAG TPA: hypothetical protein O0X39_03035, partial [Methanocorpusculum sp.]|nr:hypothetical protein [Methanocorpusculum sp.]